MNDELLRTGDVISLLGISRSTLDLWISKGDFPKPHKLGRKLNVWSANDIEVWLSKVSSAESNLGGAA